MIRQLLVIGLGLAIAVFVLILTAFGVAAAAPSVSGESFGNSDHAPIDDAGSVSSVTVASTRISGDESVSVSTENTSITTTEPLEVTFMAQPDGIVDVIVEDRDGDELYSATESASEDPTVFSLGEVPAGEYVVRIEHGEHDVTDETQPITVEEPDAVIDDREDLRLLDSGPVTNETIGPGEETFIHTVVVDDPDADDHSALIENVSLSISGLEPSEMAEVRLEAGPSINDQEPIATEPGDALNQSPEGMIVFDEFGDNGTSTYHIPDGEAHRFQVFVRLESDAQPAIAVQPATSVSLADGTEKTFEHNHYTQYEKPQGWTIFHGWSRDGPNLEKAVAYTVDKQGSDEDSHDNRTVVELSFDSNIPASSDEPGLEAPDPEDFQLILATDIRTQTPDRVVQLEGEQPRVQLDVGDLDPNEIRDVDVVGDFTDINGNEIGWGTTAVDGTDGTIAKTENQSEPLVVGPEDDLAFVTPVRNELITVTDPDGEELHSERTGFDSGVTTFNTAAAETNVTYNVTFACECDRTTRQFVVENQSVDDSGTLTASVEETTVKVDEPIEVTLTSDRERSVDVDLVSTDNETTTSQQTVSIEEGSKSVEFEGIDPDTYRVQVTDSERGLTNETEDVVVSHHKLSVGINPEPPHLSTADPVQTSVSTGIARTVQINVTDSSNETIISRTASIEKGTTDIELGRLPDGEFSVTVVDDERDQRTNYDSITVADPDFDVTVPEQTLNLDDPVEVSASGGANRSVKLTLERTDGETISEETVNLSNDTTEVTLGNPPVGEYVVRLEDEVLNWTVESEVIAINSEFEEPFNVTTDNTSWTADDSIEIEIYHQTNQTLSVDVVDEMGETVRSREHDPTGKNSTLEFEPLNPGTYTVTVFNSRLNSSEMTTVNIEETTSDPDPSNLTITATETAYLENESIVAYIASDPAYEEDRDVNVILRQATDDEDVFTLSTAVHHGGSSPEDKRRILISEPPMGAFYIEVIDPETGHNDTTDEVAVTNEAGNIVNVETPEDTLETEDISITTKSDYYTSVMDPLRVYDTEGTLVWDTPGVLFSESPHTYNISLDAGTYYAEFGSGDDIRIDETDPFNVIAVYPELGLHIPQSTMTSDEQHTAIVQANETREGALILEETDGTTIEQWNVTAERGNTSVDLPDLDVGEYELRLFDDDGNQTDADNLTVWHADDALSATTHNRTLTTEEDLPVAVDSDTERTVELVVKNKSGETVRSETASVSAGTTQLDLSSLPIGSYTVSVTSEDLAQDEIKGITVKEPDRLEIEAKEHSITTEERLELRFRADPPREATVRLESTDGETLYRTDVEAENVNRTLRLSELQPDEYVVVITNESADLTNETRPISVTRPDDDPSEVTIEATETSLTTADDLVLKVAADTYTEATVILETSDGTQLTETDAEVGDYSQTLTFSSLTPGEYRVRIENDDGLSDATTTITVTSGTDDPSGVSIEAADTSLTTADDLVLEVTADTYTEATVVLETSDGTQLTETDAEVNDHPQTLTFSSLTPGEYQVRIETDDGLTDTTDSITVTSESDDTNDDDEQQGDEGASFDAEPTQSHFASGESVAVEISADSEGELSITLETTGGAVIYESTISVSPGTTTFRLDGVPEGEYVFTFSDEDDATEVTTDVITVAN
ncbi:hypothetical protein AB7C87_02930 [Natrarchaeobius sp. A-rgal3]|uniref:hypothetical protein n=1 Tax=Natrarchaeobius versutus TaxID=1679078 RepID=UPI00350FD220